MSHPLFDRLIQEHRFIESLIEQTKQTTQQEMKSLLKKIYAINEKQHHVFEEKFLFKKAAENEKIREGGPYCVLYYNQHVSNPPIERIEKRLRKSFLRNLIR